MPWFVKPEITPFDLPTLKPRYGMVLFKMKSYDNE